MAISYDPRGMSWNQYCGLMTEMFASNQIGNVPEDKWREWVDGLNGIGYFVSSGIPDQRMYSNWQEWGQAMSGIMSISNQET